MTKVPDPDQPGHPPGDAPDDPTGRPRRSIRRRVVLGLATLAGIGVAAAAAYGGNMALVYRDRLRDNTGDLDFANPLAIPPVLEPDVDPDGRRHFRLVAEAGTSELLPDTTTPTWGINGPFLGPTLRARRGDTVAVSFVNALPEMTTLHWHGMHLPAEMDGGPHQAVEPGETWEPHWTVEQPAATLWYHPHPHDVTADHVNRGIAGLFIVDDDPTDEAGLPHEYGVDDVPLIVQDRAFHDDGSFDLRGVTFRESLTGAGSQGVFGDTILVNGTWNPHFEVTTTLVRLRLLNGSSARVYRFGFTDDRPFHLVAQENGLIPEPVELRQLQLMSGERAEIVVAFEPGDTAVLRSFPPELGYGAPISRFDGGDDTFDVLQLRAAADLVESDPLPDRFPGAPAAPTVPSDARVRTFTMEGVRINDKEMDMLRVDEVIPADTVEIWEVSGGGGQLHSMHVHGATFRVLDYAGAEPPPAMRGPKDTVHVPPGDTVRLAVAMPPYTDPVFPYMYHCHILRHEDYGMMGQFTVVEPGTEDDAPRRLEGLLDGDHDH